MRFLKLYRFSFTR